MNGIYQLVVLYGMGELIKSCPEPLLPRGYGIRNTVNLMVSSRWITS